MEALAMRSVTDVSSLKQYLMDQTVLAADVDTVEALASEVRFQDGQLIGMRYERFMVKLPINEFLLFLDASGIPREQFLEAQPEGTGCGKNYKAKAGGGCEKSDGDYCSCPASRS
jgi:hypothetical protein